MQITKIFSKGQNQKSSINFKKKTAIIFAFKKRMFLCNKKAHFVLTLKEKHLCYLNHRNDKDAAVRQKKCLFMMKEKSCQCKSRK